MAQTQGTGLCGNTMKSENYYTYLGSTSCLATHRGLFNAFTDQSLLRDDWHHSRFAAGQSRSKPGGSDLIVHILGVNDLEKCEVTADSGRLRVLC